MNNEHYHDRTAETAVGRASKPSNPKLSAAIRAVKIVLHRYGFDMVGRIVLVDRKNGKIYR